MSKKSNRETAARTEARRRARLVAQGRAVEEEESDSSGSNAAASAPPGGFLQRIFPPAAPLRGKPDPLAGFTYDGRFKPVVSSLWLIPRNPLASFGMALVSAGAWITTYIYGQSTTLGSVSSFVAFGSLIAAGWIGWQRPWLYGLIAAVIGYLLSIPFLLVYEAPAIQAEHASAEAIAVSVALNGLTQIGIGTLAGFYGGYLRRRISDPSVRQAARTAKRR